MAIHAEDGAARQVSVTDTSASTAIPNASSFYKLLVNNNGTVNVHYRLSASTPTAVAFSAGAGDPFIPPGATVELWIKGMANIAFVVVSGTATVEFFPFSEKF